MGFIDWLTGWIAGAARSVGQAVADVVHWAVHALASVVLAIFDHVFGAWRQLAEWIWAHLLALGRWIGVAAVKFYQIIRIIIPRVVRWTKWWITYIMRFIRSWVAWLWLQIRKTIALLYREIGAVVRWAWSHIFVPLWHWTQFLYRLIKAWAWVAFWWVTHLASLAEAMIFHIAAAIERNAWQLAGILGKFFLALIIRNLARFVKLAEQIIAAVL